MNNPKSKIINLLEQLQEEELFVTIETKYRESEEFLYTLHVSPKAHYKSTEDETSMGNDLEELLENAWDEWEGWTEK